MERIQEDLHWKAEMVEGERNMNAFLSRLKEKHEGNPSRARTLSLADQAIEAGEAVIEKIEREMTQLRKSRDSLDEEYRLHLLRNPEPLM